MEKVTVIQVPGVGSDVIFVGALEDGSVGLTVVNTDMGASIYVILPHERIDQLCEALRDERDR